VEPHLNGAAFFRLRSEIGLLRIDSQRSIRNETLRGPPTADGVAALATERIRAAGIVKLRRDAVLAIEVIFSLSPTVIMDDRAYFEACLEWASRQFGGEENLLSADVHRDEGAPHCHLLIQPLINNRMVGSDLVGGPGRLKQLHREFHSAVASRFGLARAPDRLGGQQKAVVIGQVLACLGRQADPALRSDIWPQCRDAIELDPAPFALALGLAIEARPPRMRSSTAIFTSPGKGPKREKESHIGFRAAPKDQTQCSVGFAVLPVVSPTFARVREDELSSTMYNSETGEFEASQRASLATEPT
jgi:hypothetical protein